MNIGDLMARWTVIAGARPGTVSCRRHASAPDEDLVSLIFFYETDHDARIASLGPAVGRTPYPEVVASQYLKEKLDAITMTP